MSTAILGFVFFLAVQVALVAVLMVADRWEQCVESAAAPAMVPVEDPTPVPAEGADPAAA